MIEDADENQLRADQLPGAHVTRAMFLEWRDPRVGDANPDQMSNPVWEWLFRNRLNAYSANQHFKGPDSLDAGPV